MKLERIELLIKSFDDKIIDQHISDNDHVIEDLTIQEDFDFAWVHMISEGDVIKPSVPKEIDNQMYDTISYFISQPDIQGTIKFKYGINEGIPIFIQVTITRS